MELKNLLEKLSGKNRVANLPGILYGELMESNDDGDRTMTLISYGKLMGAMMALCVLGYISEIDLSSAQSELRGVVFGKLDGGYNA